MAVAQSLYETYAAGGIQQGLNADREQFTLNNKEITLYSGALHYFRVPQEYWRDRLKKIRAAGLNTVETYVPWNLHEPEPGIFDYGNGGSDFQDFLDLKKFLEIAKEEDLFAIVRPGPYICSEWDFGGLPSWLLRDTEMKIRTSDGRFMSFVEKFFQSLFAILSLLQFTKGGPIIAFQIENEYGNVKHTDREYLEQIKNIFEKNGLVELFFTSDTPSNGNGGSLPGVLYTANFQNESEKELALLNNYQPNKPAMVMEYWTGWFDHWGENHHVRSVEAFKNELQSILSHSASVNFYMFHGGTNWGFMNGANILDKSIDNGGIAFDTSSYDYDAPLSEAGDYTDKYYALKKIIKKYNTNPEIKATEMPAEIRKIKYPDVNVTGMLTLHDLIDRAPHKITSMEVLPMEYLDINNKAGQSYGYIVYRRTHLDMKKDSILKIEGRVCDTVMVLINGQLVSKMLKSADDLNSFGTWKIQNGELNLHNKQLKNATLELVVENWGRNNFGKLSQFNQKKGIWQGDVYLNDAKLINWDIFPLEFKSKFNNELDDFKSIGKHTGPAVYKAVLSITGKPEDTFIHMCEWNKGIIIVNGFVLSRYFRIGPQQTAYLPAPLLHKGKNDILIFEHFEAGTHIRFSNKPIYATILKSETKQPVC